MLQQIRRVCVTVHNIIMILYVLPSNFTTLYTLYIDLPIGSRCVQSGCSVVGVMEWHGAMGWAVWPKPLSDSNWGEEDTSTGRETQGHSSPALWHILFLSWTQAQHQTGLHIIIWTVLTTQLQLTSAWHRLYQSSRPYQCRVTQNDSNKELRSRRLIMSCIHNGSDT